MPKNSAAPLRIAPRTSLRKLFVAFTAALISTAPLTAQISFTPPVSITAGDDAFGNRSPRLALNQAGDPMIFWIKTGFVDKFYLSTYSGGEFSEPAQIPLDGLNPDIWGGSLGPKIAAAAGHVYITFEIYGQAIYVVHSPDDGATWDVPVAAFTPPSGRKATIPTVAVDVTGQPFIAYVNTNNLEADAYYGLVRSEDFGATFFPEVDASESAPLEVCECCDGHIEVADNGDVYVGFRNNNENVRDCWLVRSTDGGTTFDEAFDMDQTDWTLVGCPSNGPDFYTANGDVHMAHYSGDGADGAGVYYSTLDQGALTAGATAFAPTSDESSSAQNRPKIAGDESNIAFVWQENYGGSPEIAVMASATGVDGLGTDVVRITDLPGSQTFPNILYANGSFHVVYEDTPSETVYYQEVNVGANSVESANGAVVEVFPNPASERLTVVLPHSGPAQISMSNLQGQVLFSKSVLTAQCDIPVDQVAAGVYSLSISTKAGEQNIRVIVAH